MKVIFKMTQTLLSEIRSDLRRPHPYAAERVGFISCRAGRLKEGIIILAGRYHPLADERYEEHSWAGAMIDAIAFRDAMQYTFETRASMFHVHLHDWPGRPRFSAVDDRESRKFVPGFSNVTPGMPHGAIVLSADAAVGRCWVPENRTPLEIEQFVFIGAPIRKVIGR